MAPPAKGSLKDELLALLEGDLRTLERAHEAAREGATHEEAKPENDKDTRALEQSYLARGQAARIEELRASVAAVRGLTFPPAAHARVALGALATLDEGGTESLVWLAPAGGGVKLARGTVQVITPRSPLGRALLGKEAGDEIEVSAGRGSRVIQVVRVA